VGDAAVKFTGSGLGKTGAVTGAGPEGADGAVANGACGGAAGTCCWAAASIMGRENATSAATLARRTERRIKLILLKLRKSSCFLAYT
jgi:hypothetical protein